ncbi:hypothetical protein [Aeromonas hydrophila]|uniref:hypothetical protein n=1 Tax=Aeromonas hydrophila TaxID=644 RepID=UPI003D254198
MRRDLLILAALTVLLGVFLGGMRYIARLTTSLATANSTIEVLQEANTQVASDFEALQRAERGLRTLLAHQNTELAVLDQQHRETADALQDALATPPAGRPDCAREPLPDGALRLLKPAAAHSDNDAGGQAPAAARAGAVLPGA